MATFTASHMNDIAGTITAIRDTLDGLPNEDYLVIVHHFAMTLARSNPRFDLDRFVDACGIQADVFPMWVKGADLPAVPTSGRHQ